MPQPLRQRQQFGVNATKSRYNKRIRKHVRRQGTVGLLSMPGEILLDLVSYLYLPDLEALSFSCKHFYDVFRESLCDEQKFARDKLRDITLLPENFFGYHDLLLGILKREINPNYVKRFDCRKACISRTSLSYSGYLNEGDEIEAARYIGWTPEDISLVRKTILKSPWLENVATPDEMIQKMLHNDEDAVLALLVPLMKKLLIWIPPYGGKLLRLVFVKIARAQIVAELTNPYVWLKLPLRRLHTIYSSADAWGVSLIDMVHYMSLPSVRCILSDCVWYEGPEPQTRAELRSLRGIPESRVQTVYFRFGDMWRNMTECFADHITGPCVMRQYMSEPMPTDAQLQESWVAERLRENGAVPDDPISYYWDHCTITPSRDEDHATPYNRSLASQAPKATDGRTVEFSIKYRSFHHESEFRDGAFVDNVAEYAAEIQASGTVPSPQWLALARWDRCLVKPDELDDNTFMLEE